MTDDTKQEIPFTLKLTEVSQVLKITIGELRALIRSRELEVLSDPYGPRIQTQSIIEFLGRNEFKKRWPWGWGRSNLRNRRKRRRGDRMILKREPKAICSVCDGFVYDNVDPEKIITCGTCVQRRLAAFSQKNSPLEKDVKNRVSEIVSKTGIRKVASSVGMSRSSIQRRLRTGNFSEKEISDILQAFPAPGSSG